MDLPEVRKEFEVEKKICVIGGGPAGLAALKVALDTPQVKSGLWSITLYEARQDIGGVWLPALPTDDPPLTPLYDSLTTNLPHPVMAYTSYSFPPSTPLFPHASVVEEYLKSYASHFKLTPHIHLNTTVQSTKREGKAWKVQISTSPQALEFDLLIVANGHYRVPRFPQVSGLDSWLAQKKASHSAYYRHPHNLGRKILVVGAGPSGNDIATEMCSVSETVVQSIPGTLPTHEGNLKLRGRVTRFESDGTVVFEDGSIESGIDHCILATGYETSFPFLSSPDLESHTYPPSIPPLPSQLYDSSYHVFPLALHLFPLTGSTPNVAFLGLPVRVAPFPLLEAQAHAVVRVLADSSALDTTKEAVDVISRYEHLRAQLEPPRLPAGGQEEAIAKLWHKFEGLEQFDYRDELYVFALGEGSAGQVKVPDWEKEAYLKKDMLRRLWVGLEKSGEASEWVKNVGDGGPHEWAEFLRRLIDYGEKQEEKSKL